MKYEAGFKLMDLNWDYEVIEYMEQFKMYRLRYILTGADNKLMKEEEIDDLIENEDITLIKRERRAIREAGQEERDRLEVEKIKQQEYEFNFCYGYCDKKSDLQKGKILKILNTKEFYNNVLTTRKSLIENLIKDNTNIELSIYNNTNRYSSKKVCLTYKKLADKIEYTIKYNKDYLIDVTKTEYDYASYLIDNNLILNVAV